MAHQFAIRQSKGISIALVIHSFDPCLREVLGFHLIMQAGVGFRCAQSNLRDSKDWSGMMEGDVGTDPALDGYKKGNRRVDGRRLRLQGAVA